MALFTRKRSTGPTTNAIVRGNETLIRGGGKVYLRTGLSELRVEGRETDTRHAVQTAGTVALSRQIGLTVQPPGVEYSVEVEDLPGFEDAIVVRIPLQSLTAGVVPTVTIVAPPRTFDRVVPEMGATVVEHGPDTPHHGLAFAAMTGAIMEDQHGVSRPVEGGLHITTNPVS